MSHFARFSMSPDRGLSARVRGSSLLAAILAAVLPLPAAAHSASPLVLWFARPASTWAEALPVGNGRLGAMIFGGAAEERLQLNEIALWSGGPQDADNPAALEALPSIRTMLFAGRYREAQALADRTLIAKGRGSGRGRVRSRPTAAIRLWAISRSPSRDTRPLETTAESSISRRRSPVSRIVSPLEQSAGARSSLAILMT